MPRTLFLLAAVAALTVAAVAVSACGDDDDGDSGGVAVLSPASEPDPEADPEAEGPATPAPKPDDATEVDVTLGEWEVVPASASIPAGKIYFKVRNDGPQDAHEFVVIRTDLAPGDLPVENGRVTEDAVDIIDEIEPFAPDSTGSITLNLDAGSYALICNIAEQDGDEIESHYELGMHAAFTVT